MIDITAWMKKFLQTLNETFTNCVCTFFSIALRAIASPSKPFEITRRLSSFLSILQMKQIARTYVSKYPSRRSDALGETTVV